MDAEMSHMCFCEASSTLKTCWTDENPSRIFWVVEIMENMLETVILFCWHGPPVNVRSKVVIVGLRRKVAAMEKEFFFGILILGVVFFCGLYFENNFLLIVKKCAS
ncbi:hypothetical protein GQ457_05G030120 [Hibiscus cannabinus]